MTDITIDLTAARAALAELQPRLATIEPRRIRGLRLRGVCLGLVNYIAALRTDDRLARLQTLDGVDGWSVGCVADLDKAARALWVVLTELRTDRAAPGFTLDPALEAQAVKRRAEMRRIIAFYAHDDAIVQAELADIRKGTGFEDLGIDLERLAKLYAALDVPAGAVGYSPDDADAALQDAGAIAASLAAQRGPDASALRDTSERLQGLILQQWGALTAGGRFLYRDRSGAALFPTLGALAS